ncbi:MAG: NAD(P)-binding domain-containing protein [Chloroflexota bacterium]
MEHNKNSLPVAIIGGGPVGLAAAAHLIERDIEPLIFEAGASVGQNVREWGHVRMFSPWEFTVDSASVRLLEDEGWTMPPADALPTGDDLYELYMAPLAAHPAIAPKLHLGARVEAVTRENIDKMKDTGRGNAPFVLHVSYADGREARFTARAVIDASGTYHNPNPLGSGGLPAIGERGAKAHVFYGIPDVLGKHKVRFSNKRTVVVGSGHSAINAVIDLATLHASEPDTEIVWAVRGTNMAGIYGGLDDDALEARGALGKRVRELVERGALVLETGFRVAELEATASGVRVVGETADGLRTVEADEVIATTGARPDLNMLRELRLDLHPSLESAATLGPLIDPNIHSCGTVPPHGEAELRQPEPNFYIVGMKSYGRAPTFLLATGFEQVRSVVAALAGDWEAARDVRLNLPETGVCSTDFAIDGVGGGCCAPASSAADEDACCAPGEVANLGLIDLGNITIK